MGSDQSWGTREAWRIRVSYLLQCVHDQRLLASLDMEKSAKTLHAIFHCFSKITSVWSWTIACVLRNLFEINFYSWLLQAGSFIVYNLAGVQEVPKMIYCHLCLLYGRWWNRYIIGHMRSFWLETTGRLSFYLKARRAHAVEGGWDVECSKWNNYLQD